MNGYYDAYEDARWEWARDAYSEFNPDDIDWNEIRSGDIPPHPRARLGDPLTPWDALPYASYEPNESSSETQDKYTHGEHR